MSRPPALEADRSDGSRGPAARPVSGAPRHAQPTTSNLTFGVDYWILGLLAASPALISTLGFLLVEVRLPRVVPFSLGGVLGVLIVGLALVTLFVRFLDYPAWSQPAVVLLPIYGLFLPAVVLHGQVLTQANGDPDPIVAVPVVVTWALMTIAAIVAVAVAVTVGRYAPSYSGTALVPLPVILAWVVVLMPSFTEERLARALASSLALAACTAVAAWVLPSSRRPLAPLVAIGAQLALFWWLGLGWPGFGGAVELIVLLDVALYVLLIVLIGLAPPCASWMRRAGWPELQRLLRG